MSDRTPRQVQSREHTARDVYRPPSTLPDPDPVPGVVFRWVSTHVLGDHDPANVSNRFRDGWEPVKASDHPELAVAATASGNIEIGGLMLCRNSEERMKARQRYYAQQNAAQMEAIDNQYMQQQDKRMPLFSDRDSRVARGSFGNGEK